MTAQPRDIKDVFLQAADISSSEERGAFLDDVCAGDPSMRKRVDALLAAHESSESLLDDAALPAGPSREDLPTLDTSMSDKPGAMVGPYKLLQEIGEGGMGVVYMAEQKSPIRRRVALKIIKPGMDSRQVIARFEAERQALAMMDHPNIARVLDAGTTENGRPYFVMELVKGVPVTQYCDENHLSANERLELFLSVCDAVQHAHQKGVIHRDIKPSNVLVAEYDHQAIPKIIDFGVAKALNQQLTEKTVFTQYGQIIGTPEYMSPEQAKFNQLDVDTRSDIYSLGVMLYELLTGETPFDRKRLRSAAFDELVRIIREEDPPKPSTRVKTSVTLPAIAAARRTTPPKLGTMLQGELDWIIMKALDKDRARRYDTARDFALDVKRYLSGDPVHATSPGSLYKLRKIYQHNRLAFAAAAAIFLLLVLGAVGASVGWYYTSQARNQLADTLREKNELLVKNNSLLTEQTRLNDTLRKERERADAAAMKAEQEAAIATAVNDFLNEDLLASIAPSSEEGKGYDVRMRQVLDVAARKLERDSQGKGRFAGKPLVEAAIRRTIGRSYWAVGKYDLAEKHLQKAMELRSGELGEQHEETLKSVLDLGELRRWQRDYESAKSYFERAREAWTKLEGPTGPNALEAKRLYGYTLHRLGKTAEAEQCLRETIDSMTSRFGPHDTKTLQCKLDLGVITNARGKWNEAEQLFEEAIDGLRATLGDKHEKTLLAIFNFGAVHHNLSVQETLRREAFDGMNAVYGREHPIALLAGSNLGALLFRSGNLEEAEQVCRDTLETARRVLGDEPLVTALAAQNLAAACNQLGKLTDAERNSRLRWDFDREAGRYLRAFQGFQSLMAVLKKQGKFDEASVLTAELLSDCQRLLKSDNPEQFKYVANAIFWLDDEAEYSQSAELAEQLLIAHARPSEEIIEQHTWVLGMLGRALVKQHRFDEAKPILEKCLGVSERQYEANEWGRYWPISILGECRAEMGEAELAEEQLLTGLENLVANGAPWNLVQKARKRLLKFYRNRPSDNRGITDHCRLVLTGTEGKRLETVNHLLEVMFDLKMHADGEDLARQLLQVYRQTPDGDKVVEAWTLGLLGSFIMKQGRYSEAEVVLREFESVQHQAFSQEQWLWHWPTVVLGECSAGQGQSAEAEKLLLDGCEGVILHNSGVDPFWACVHRLTAFYRSDRAQGSGTPNSMVERCTNKFDEQDSQYLGVAAMACEVLRDIGEYDDLEEICNRRLALQKQSNQTDAWNLAWSHGLLCEALLGQGHYEKARRAAEECQRLQREWCSEYTPQWYWPVSLIGRCDWKQGRYEAAESRLVEAFDGVRRYGTGTEHDVRVELESLNRLVSFYKDWNEEYPSGGYDQLAAKYRSMLDRYQDVAARAQSDSPPESN